MFRSLTADPFRFERVAVELMEPGAIRLGLVFRGQEQLAERD